MYKTILFSLVLFLTIVHTNSNPPATDVFEALRYVCKGKFQGGLCPYAIAYDIATQLAGNWHDRDGATGLWSDGGPAICWPSGVGLWAFAEFFNTMGGRATDKLYLATRWAAIETAKKQNNYVHTKFTDDQAWWANGALRLEQYIRSIGDATQELINAAQAVINDNVAHETEECGGGLYWYYGKSPPSTTDKTTISNVLTIYTMATMYSFTHDPTLLQGGAHGGAIDIYNWLVSTDLLNNQTGYQRDTLDTANGQCQLRGGSLTYEYGVLVQALIALTDATGNQQYMTHAMTYIRNAINQFTRNNIIFEGCDDTNTCTGDQIAFRGIFYLGLARLYERTHDDAIAQVIEASYLAMLSRKVGNRYPLSLINNNNNFTGKDLIVVTIGDLNLASAMMKVYKYKYAPPVVPNIDAAVNGLLPFDITHQGLTGCVCDDVGCPTGHYMQCFNDSGHKDSTGSHHWNEKVSAILIGPSHQMMLFKPKGAGHSDWLKNSQWYVGDDWNDKVDSINIDY
ncbi:unnamed protein product [Adineta steineri]|uniref:Uncharacterized protein n=1 Tax=Adineta steineri TaxID=433720 RepID=A0A814NQJ0_9BILA|nr:unnamed protein product [Adineta steineri]